MFTATVVLTAKLAVAANTTIFRVVNAVILRPLPFGEPDRIVQIAEKNDKLNLPTFASSVLNFLGWREQPQSFSEMGGISFNNYTLTGPAQSPEECRLTKARCQYGRDLFVYELLTQAGIMHEPAQFACREERFCKAALRDV